MESALTSAKNGKSSASSAEVTYLQKNLNDLSKKVSSMETTIAKSDSAKPEVSADDLKTLQKNINDKSVHRQIMLKFYMK